MTGKNNPRLSGERSNEMQAHKRNFLIIIALIAVSSAALAIVGRDGGGGPTPIVSADGPSDSVLSLKAELVQQKVLLGSPGKAALALELAAANLPTDLETVVQPVDLVVVLDRSGSMGGRKLNDARRALRQLIEQLTPADRLALVTYANRVTRLAPLTAMTDSQRSRMAKLVSRISAGGGTNLGDGLRRGIKILRQTPGTQRQRRVILISDGLANQGVTDPQVLAEMASAAQAQGFGVSTVGVGYDFNEVLMTTLADHGAGRYYFLEDPDTFAQVFENEFQTARNVAAACLEIRIPLSNGIRLVAAGGYPVKQEGQDALLYPGDLLAGQTRKLFLTFQVPTHSEETFKLNQVQVRYQQDGKSRLLTDSRGWTVACVRDPKEVVASVDRDAWGVQVVQEDYSQLKEEVARAIREGEKEQALDQIRDYEQRNRAMNQSIGSASVAQNIEVDVKALRDSVAETFAGPPAAVAEKKKQQAKALQYESYKMRRDKK
jgi:Ca-activated chloride channel family protein